MHFFIVMLLLLCLVGENAIAGDSLETVLDNIEKQIESKTVPETSSQELEKILETDPKNSRAHVLMGECLDVLGLKEQSLDQFRIALDCGRDYPPAYVGLVKEYIKQGHLQEAKTLIQEAKQRFPKDHEIEFWLGNFYQSREQYSEAMKQYQEALKSEKPILGLASAIAKLKFHDRQPNYFDAIAYADQDIKLKPKFPMANEIKGLSLHHLGLYKDALLPLSIAYEANPYNIDVAFAYAQCLYWQGDDKAALSPALVHLAFNANLSANDLRSKRLVAEIITRMHSSDEINEVIVSTGLKVPVNNRAAYHFSLADVLDRNGFNKLAMKEYEFGLKLKPDFGRAWYRLGLDYESIDRNYGQALECYKKARIYLPGDKQIASQENRLEDRLAKRTDDLAWQLKDKIKTLGGKQ